MENFRKNLLPEPEITDSAEDSLRIQFRLPVAAEYGKAPGKLIRKFRTKNSFQVSFFL